MSERRWPDAPDGRPLVKVCGVTTVADARMCVRHGVDAIGLNFWPDSPRFVEPRAARAIARAIGDTIAIVGLFVDADVKRIRTLEADVGFGFIQLHGREPPEMVVELGPNAFKALRVGADGVDEEAARYGGALLLLDALVEGEVGGTGRRFDWRLAAGLSSRRAVILAGGLTPDNVAEALATVRPRGVDVASGVESAKGQKDEAAVAAFVAEARRVL